MDSRPSLERSEALIDAASARITRASNLAPRSMIQRTLDPAARCARACVWCVRRARNPANDTTRHCDTKTRDTRAAAARISNLSQHRRHLDFKQLYIFRPVFGRRAHSVVMSLEVRWKASGEKINIPRGETHCLVGRDSAPIHGEFTSSRRRARSASGTGEIKRKKRSLALFPTTIVRDGVAVWIAFLESQGGHA